MTKENIIDYALESPHNTNRAVLNSMLDQVISGDNKEEVELTVTSNNTYIPNEGQVYNRVVVNVPKPTSNFSTAMVYVKNESNHSVTFTVPMASAHISSGSSSPAGATTRGTLPANNNGTGEVILYKGVAILIFDSNYQVTLKNNVTSMGNGTYKITGNATLTVTA